MRIVHVSDSHRKLDQITIEPCDILIHTGDDDINFVKDAVKLNRWFKNQSARLKIFCPGNHDWLFQKDYNIGVASLDEATVLIDKQIEFEGLKIYGTPYQPAFCDWAFNLPRDGKELQAKWDLVPNNIDILLTHTPPFGILDYIPDQNKSVGCKLLLESLKRIKPKYHLFGHIHEGYGTATGYWDTKQTPKYDLTTYEKKTIFLNSAILDGDYQLANKPQVFEI